MTVIIIDYGMGNLGSIGRGLETCGANVLISSNPMDIEKGTHVVIPGVGSFKDGMQNLTKLGFDQELKKAALNDKIPVLGICLGMQLLCSEGYEGGESKGLDLIPGQVKRIDNLNKKLKLPHVGWNEITKRKPSKILESIEDKEDFYFVHSYQFQPDDNGHITSITNYGKEIVSSVEKENIFGLQFHPEKSSRSGLKILKNFIQS